MLMHVLPCRICKVQINHQVVTVHDNLPPNVAVLECTGCGCLGIARIEEKTDECT
jgi:hypothetical protein